MSLLPVEQAQSRLLQTARPIIDIEHLSLHDCDGRVLADNMEARLTQPPFDASAMDGYALKAANAAEPGAVLRVVGESAAGHGFGGVVGEGEAVRIFTGAPVPAGADAVLLQEDAENLDGKRIRTTFPVTLGRHIRPYGQDFRQGDIALNAGTVVDFTRITLAAAMNHASLPVYRRPRVAIIATGDELVSPGGQPGPSQIIGSNTFGIAALARAIGADVIDLGIVPDDRIMITNAIAQAQTAKADVVVTLGGASVGDHDLVQSTLLAAGMTLDFWKIAMRPGKPLMVGSLGSTHVLGLPGNLRSAVPRTTSCQARPSTFARPHDDGPSRRAARGERPETGLSARKAEPKRSRRATSRKFRQTGFVDDEYLRPVRLPDRPAAACARNGDRRAVPDPDASAVYRPRPH